MQGAIALNFILPFFEAHQECCFASKIDSVNLTFSYTGPARPKSSNRCPLAPRPVGELRF